MEFKKYTIDGIEYNAISKTDLITSIADTNNDIKRIRFYFSPDRVHRYVHYIKIYYVLISEIETLDRNDKTIEKIPTEVLLPLKFKSLDEFNAVKGIECDTYPQRGRYNPYYKYKYLYD